MKELGENLRFIRLQKKMTLQELSQMSRVSKSQLSQIERGVSVPTVAKLQNIAEALDINLSSLLPENGDSSSDADPVNNKENSKRISVVRKGERKKIVMPWGAMYEMLCPDLQHKIEFIYLHYPAGTTAKEQYTHDGEECGLVLEGKFKGTFGAMEVILEPGDSIYYDSTIPHYWETVGDTDVRAIWAITPPSF
ncbi:MAG: cupin domain-containing protein [Desulfobacterales bacterium]|nr:cupin domain-containing protein [Desulfobacterales bacterium]